MDYVMICLFFAGAILCMVFLSRGVKNRDAIESEMDENDFIIGSDRNTLKAYVVWIIVWVVFGGYNFIQYDAEVFTYFLYTISLIFLIIAPISIACWKCVIQGNDISIHRFLRRKQTFSFDDIHSIRIVYARLSRGTYKTASEIPEIWSALAVSRTKRGRYFPVTVHQIILYSQSKRLLTVASGSLGYKILVRRLKQKGIKGAEFIPEPSREKAVSAKEIIKNNLKNKGLVLWALQVLFIIPACFITVIAYVFNAWFFVPGSHTAQDVLNGYLTMFQTVFWEAVAAVAFIIIANLIIIVSLRRSTGVERKHIASALIGFIVTGFFAVSMNSFDGSIPAMIQEVKDDIAAIESGELLTSTYYIRLSWENYYRSSSLRDMGEYRPLYVVNSDSVGSIYFPESLGPARLKETTLDINYRLTGQVEDARIFEISFTPNYHVVVNAAPLSNNGLHNAPEHAIKSITYITSPSWGQGGNMITVETTVYLSGDVVRIETNDLDELVSSKLYYVDKDLVTELFDAIINNGFFDWPDKISDDRVMDGSFEYFLVETESDSYKKGGLNPRTEGFVICKNIFYKCIAQ